MNCWPSLVRPRVTSSWPVTNQPSQLTDDCGWSHLKEPEALRKGLITQRKAVSLSGKQNFRYDTFIVRPECGGITDLGDHTES